MKRRYLLTPMALLSSACALRPWTPSVSVAYWSQDPPAWKTVNLPAAQDAIATWQLPPTSPWAPYQKLTLLASLDSVRRETELPEVERLTVVERAIQAAARVGAASLPAGTLWIVDLRGAASVAFGATLSRVAREQTALVLTFNNWPAMEELIPAEETLAALVAMQPNLQSKTQDTPEEDSSSTGVGQHPVFLLDAWRLAYRFDEPDDGVTDNRYMLMPTDLPDPGMLASQRIRRVIYVVEDLDDTETEEDDLHQALLAYARAGVQIHMVDLAWLSDLQADRWDEALAGRVLPVRDRRTLVDDPMFYARARGGFGGIHVGPSPYRLGTLFRPGRTVFSRSYGGRGGGFGG